MVKLCPRAPTSFLGAEERLGCSSPPLLNTKLLNLFLYIKAVSKLFKKILIDKKIMDCFFGV